MVDRGRGARTPDRLRAHAAAADALRSRPALRSPLVCLAGLLLAVTVVYARTLTWPYLYEDQWWHTFAWPGWGAWLGGLRESPARGLTRLLWDGIGAPTDYAAVWQRTGSLTLHLLTGTGVWWLARRVLTGSVLGPVLATGLFLLHPLQTEAVVEVAYRSELVMGLAVVIALVCAERGWGRVAFVAACAAAGGKETGIIALAVVPLWASWRALPWWTPQTRGRWLTASAPLIGIGVAWAGYQQWVLLETGDQVRMVGMWVWLLGQWVWPVSQTIDPDWTQRLTGPVLLGIGALSGIGLRLIRRPWTWPGFVTAWCALLILPRLVWNTGEGLHEHHLYLATPILSLAAGGLVAGRPT